VFAIVCKLIKKKQSNHTTFLKLTNKLDLMYFKQMTVDDLIKTVDDVSYWAIRQCCCL